MDHCFYIASDQKLIKKDEVCGFALPAKCINQSFGEGTGCRRPPQVRRDTPSDHASWWMEIAGVCDVLYRTDRFATDGAEQFRAIRRTYWLAV
jgi:hypothetical protein